ncbi:MAG: ribonuclease HI family protein [Candidatus Aadella gelida]|nr:ribonuclease HI family protein [Candidatus Aadella gelida]
MSKIESAKRLEIFTDGGSRGNPGPSGVGAVLLNDKGVKISEISEFIGDATNNVAEYVAVICALQEALKIKATEITLHLDSQLVARQLKGQYKVKDRNIRKFFVIADSLIKSFKAVKINEIPREENKEADKLVNNALDLNTLV